MDWLITIIISKLYLWKITGSRGKTILDPFKYLIKQPLFQYLKNCRFYFHDKSIPHSTQNQLEERNLPLERNSKSEQQIY